MIWVSSLRGLPTFHFHISMKLVSVARYEVHPIRKIERRLPSPSPKIGALAYGLARHKHYNHLRLC